MTMKIYSTRRVVRLLAVGSSVAMAAALVGCSSANTGASESGGPVAQLTFQQFDPAPQVTGLQKGIDKFNATHPKIHVTMQNVAFADALNTYVREESSGSGPDVLHTAFTWTAALAKNKQIVDLSKLMKSDPPSGGGAEAFIGRKINSFDGSMYALPFTADTFALTYNPDNLSAAGINHPPTTWSELTTDAKKLTTGGNSGLCIPMSGVAGSEIWHSVNDYLWSHGQSVIKKTGSTWAPGTTDAELASAISYFKAFLTDGSAPQNVVSIPLAGDPVITNGLATGKCAMTVQVPAEFSVPLATNPKLLSVTMPKGPDGLAMQMGGRSLSINPNSKYKEQAWTFIRYITSAGFFQKYYTNQIPAQITLLKSRKFSPALSSKNYDGFIDGLLIAKTYVQYVGSPMPIPSVWNALAAKFNAAYVGQLSPQQAAQQLNAEYRTKLAG